MKGRLQQVLALLLWGLVIAAVGLLVGGDETHGQTPNRAGLVIQFDDGRIESSCVEFDEPSISGAELLQRAGLPVVLSSSGGLGSGVCKIDDTGCDNPGNCFCRCVSADCAFWQYYSRMNGRWRFQALGASSRDLRHGDVDGWRWGDGSSPPELTFAQICPLSSAPTQPRPQATATPRASSQAEPATPRSGPALPNDDVPDAPQATRSNVDGGIETPLETPDGTPRATPGATPLAVNEPVATPRLSAEAESDPEPDGGAPVSLIAFGAAAGAIVVGAGGLYGWRRSRG